VKASFSTGGDTLSFDDYLSLAEDIKPASRRGRWVQLVPIRAEHMEFLYALVTSDETGPRWRFGGVVPSFETFQRQLSDGVLVQFIAQSTDQAVNIGHVVAYAPDMIGAHACVAGVVNSDAIGTGFAIEVLEVFIDYLFATYPLDKLYFEVPEYNLHQFAKGYRDLMHCEAILKGHIRYGGRKYDRMTLALYRTEWIDNAEVARRRRIRCR
jgi:RimJ/RimL family protein N-acetyltransferase